MSDTTFTAGTLIQSDWLQDVNNFVYRGGANSGLVKVAVIGDSMAATNNLVDLAWPDQLAARLNASGAPTTMYNLAKDGWTYNKANTVATFGTNTMVQEAIALKPNIVFVNLGANDAILNIEGRTISQVQTDAFTLFTALRAGLPTALIVYGSELMYDSANFTPGSIKNKGTSPIFWQLKTSGILTGLNTSEVLEDQLGSTYQTGFTNWVTLDSYVKTFTSIDTTYTVPYFKAARLGLVGTDKIHLNSSGHLFLAAAAHTAIYTDSKFRTLYPTMMSQEYPPWNIPDTVFSTFLTPLADGYVNNTYDSQVTQMSRSFANNMRIQPDVWYVPSKGMAKVSSLTYAADSNTVQFWDIFNSRPNTLVEVSVNGSAFASAGMTTDYYGRAQFPFIPSNLAPGTYLSRYKVGDEVYGPFNVVITATTVNAHVDATLTNTAVTGGDGNTVNVVFNSVSSDTTSSYNSSTGIFTVPRAGRYTVSTAVGITSLPANGACIVHIAKNGSILKSGPVTYNAAGSAAYFGSTVSATIALAASDQINIKLYQYLGGTLNISPPGPNGTVTWLTISYIGP